MSDTESLGDIGLFEEPESFRPAPPEAHYASYTRETISKAAKYQTQNIDLRLIGASPLWGHLLWNAGKYTAMHLDKYPEIVRDKTVLELGAASSLPSLVSALVGARKVVCTDYPDTDLISNIEYNVQHLEPIEARNKIVVEGYIWGNSYEPLLSHIQDENHFDLLILSDLVFNHTEHHKLLRTTKDLMKRDGKALVVFSPHRPKLLQNDLEFFELAKTYQLQPKLIELVNWSPMFEEDEETAEIRSRVYAYYLEHTN